MCFLGCMHFSRSDFHENPEWGWSTTRVVLRWTASVTPGLRKADCQAPHSDLLKQTLHLNRIPASLLTFEKWWTERTWAQWAGRAKSESPLDSSSRPEERRKVWVLAAWLKGWGSDWMTVSGYFKAWSMQRAFQTSGSQAWLHIRVTWRALKILIVQGVPLHHENQTCRGWYQHQYFKFSFLHQCFPTSTWVTVRARSSSVVGAILWVSGCFTASLAWPTRSQQHTPIVTTNVPRYCQCPSEGTVTSS